MLSPDRLAEAKRLARSWTGAMPADVRTRAEMTAAVPSSSRNDYVFFGYDIYNCFSPASEDEIFELESRIGRSLPGAYREFLATFNGGTLADTLDLPKKSDSPNASDSPRSLFAIGESVAMCPDASLLHVLDRCTWHPPWSLPIGASTLNDCIGLSLRKESFGAIYVFDYKLYSEGIASEKCAFLLADSFEKLFAESSLHRPRARSSNQHASFRAIEESDFSGFRQLVKTSVDADAAMPEGYHLFWCLNRPRFVRHLLDVGANPHVSYGDGCPINRCEVLESAQLLVKHGANPNSLSATGATPILQTDRYRIHELLLTAGADVNFVAPNGLCVRVDARQNGFRQLWERYGLDLALICDRLCSLMSDPDSPWESADDDDAITVGEYGLVNVIEGDARLIQKVTDVQLRSKNALVQSRVRRVLSALSGSGAGS